MATAVALKEAADTSYRLELPLSYAVDIVFKSYIERIRTIEKQLKALDAAIEKDLLLSLTRLNAQPMYVV